MSAEVTTTNADAIVQRMADGARDSSGDNAILGKAHVDARIGDTPATVTTRALRSCLWVHGASSQMVATRLCQQKPALKVS
jgi:hypothetical protein